MERKYPRYTQMDKNFDTMSENRQQPPPYSSGVDTPHMNSYQPAHLTTPAIAPAVMPTIVTVNNIGGSGGGATVGNIAVGRDPVIMTCPHCRCRNKTRIKGRSTIKTHLACLLLSWTGLCCLPYCMMSCRNVDHFCTICGAFLGSYAS